MTDTTRTNPPACSRYLPVEPDALDWGIHVLDCGYTDIPPHTRYPFGRSEDTMHRARRYLLSRADGAIDLQQLAARLGMSYSRFRSLFEEHTGMPPRQYHLQIRINKAERLLAETDLTVSEIAARLGFSSVYYFSRLFSKKAGTSPTAFRKNATGS